MCTYQMTSSLCSKLDKLSKYGAKCVVQFEYSLARCLVLKVVILIVYHLIPPVTSLAPMAGI